MMVMGGRATPVLVPWREVVGIMVGIQLQHTIFGGGITIMEKEVFLT